MRPHSEQRALDKRVSGERFVRPQACTENVGLPVIMLACSVLILQLYICECVCELIVASTPLTLCGLIALDTAATVVLIIRPVHAGKVEH